MPWRDYCKIMGIEVFHTKKPMQTYPRQKIFWAWTALTASISNPNRTWLSSSFLTLPRIRIFASRRYHLLAWMVPVQMHGA